VLAFLHVGSRTVFVTKASSKLDAAWMKELSAIQNWK